MKKVLSSILALCLCMASLSVGLLASAEQAEPLVWDFVQDTEGWQTADGRTTSFAHDAENGRINVTVLAGHGTAGISQTFAQPIDGTKYEAVKITMAQGFIPPATASSVKQIQGYVGYNEVDNVDYQVPFTAQASGDLFEVTVPLTKDNWKTEITAIRIAFDITAQGLTNGNVLIFDKVELVPAKEEAPAPATDVTFSFDTDLEGFANNVNQASSLEYDSTEKALKGNMLLTWGSVVAQKSFDTPFAGSSYKTIVVSIKNPTAKELTALVSFSTVDDQTNIVEQPTSHVRLTVPANMTEYQDFYFQVGENAAWQAAENVDTLRVQLAVDQGQMTVGGAVYINEIKMLTTVAEAPDTDPGTEPGTDPDTDPDTNPDTDTTPDTATDVTFSFDTDLEGFANNVNQASSLEYDSTEKALKGNMLLTWGSVVAQKSFDTPFAGSSYKTIVVSIKNPTEKALTALVSFSTVDDQTNIVEQPTSHVRLTVPANMTEYQDFYFQVGENAAWQAAENVDTLRVQLAVDQGQMTVGGAVYINEIKMLTKATKPETDNDDNNGQSGTESTPEAKPQNLVWSFETGNAGWQNAFNDANSQIRYDGTGKHLNIIMQSSTGNAGLLMNFETPINGADYGEFRLKMAQGFLPPATASSVKAVKGYIAYTDGDMAKLDSEANREYFSVPALGDVFEVKVPMTKDSWKNGKISAIRIGFVIDGQFGEGNAIVFEKITLLTAEEAAKKPTSYVFDFTNSLNGFAVPSFITNCVVNHVDGAMEIRNMQVGRLIAQTVLTESIDGTALDKLKIRVKNTAGAGSLTLAFGTVSDQGANIDKTSHQVKVTLNKTNKTDYIEYTVDMSQNSAWKSANDINIIRLSFYGDNESMLPVGANVSVKSMRFYNSKATQTGVENYMVPAMLLLVISFGGVVIAKTVKRKEEK